MWRAAEMLPANEQWSYNFMKHYPSLDGIRGIAVLLVLIAHSGYGPIRSGAPGVDVFFTLSGFLITSILLDECYKHKSINFKNFYARRCLRLIPCLVVVVGVCSVLGYWQAVPQWPKHALYAITYTMNWGRALHWTEGGMLAHTWSLAVEEQFYLIWPVVVLLLCKLPGRAAAGALAVAIAASVAYRWIQMDGTNAARIYQGIDTHSDTLLFGSFTAFFVARAGHWSSNILRSIVVVGSVAIITWIVLMYGWWDWQMQVFGYSAIGLATSLLIYDCVSPGSSWVRLVLDNQALCWLGKVSYGLYLWHYPLYWLLRKVDFIWGYRLPLVGIPLTVAVAALSYYLMEQRFLAAKSLFVRRPRVSSAAKEAARTLAEIGV